MRAGFEEGCRDVGAEAAEGFEVGARDDPVLLAVQEAERHADAPDRVREVEIEEESQPPAEDPKQSTLRVLAKVIGIRHRKRLLELKLGPISTSPLDAVLVEAGLAETFERSQVVDGKPVKRSESGLTPDGWIVVGEL